MPIFRKKAPAKPVKEVRIWARPEMLVTFRAEIMPGTEREDRTYRVKTVLSNGRVILHDFPDEHRESSFEPVNFRRNVTR
jgi:hypothetical protein